MTAALWKNIPHELRERNQWVIAGPDKVPYYVDGAGAFHKASVTNPATWLSFDIAAWTAYRMGGYIGFVLSENDPYACLDFDYVDEETQLRKGQPVDPSKHTPAERYEYFVQQARHINSYTEISISGKGFHIWIRGVVGDGMRHEGVELYDRARYMICTGNVVIPSGIGHHQWVIDETRQVIQAANPPEVELVEVAEELTDHEVWTKLVNADNQNKALPLWEGRWSELGYPSQSEADLSLMSMLAFYSKSNEQCRRLFRMSALGQRDKATKNNKYLNYTLRVIRSRIAAEDEQFQKVQANMEANLNQGDWIGREVAKLNAGTTAAPVTTAAPMPETALVNAAPVPREVREAKGEISWPPGMVGAVAQFIYQSAPRPVKEVAIVGALGLLAGITGKVWGRPGTGLNLYITLVGRSGIGKEAMHSGVSALVKALRPTCRTIDQYVTSSTFASGPALIKQCIASQSFVQLASEWGKRLKKIAEDRDAGSASLEAAMTELYQKSGESSVLGGLNYSDQDKNVESTPDGVAYSLIGETRRSRLRDLGQPS